MSAWELGPSDGYVDALVSTVSARGAEEEGHAATGARLLAAICLKNVAARRWRPRRGEALDGGENVGVSMAELTRVAVPSLIDVSADERFG